MQASSSLPAITYSSSVLFPSSGGTSSAHTSKREARAAAHTTRATPEAWTEVKGLANAREGAAQPRVRAHGGVAAVNAQKQRDRASKARVGGQA